MAFIQNQTQPLRAICIHSLCTFWGTEELLREWQRRDGLNSVFVDIFGTPDDFCFTHHPSPIIHHLAKIISRFLCQHGGAHLRLKAVIAPDDVHVGKKNPNKSLQLIWRGTTQTGSSSIERQADLCSSEGRYWHFRIIQEVRKIALSEADWRCKYPLKAHYP